MKKVWLKGVAAVDGTGEFEFFGENKFELNLQAMQFMEDGHDYDSSKETALEHLLVNGWTIEKAVCFVGELPESVKAEIAAEEL